MSRRLITPSRAFGAIATLGAVAFGVWIVGGLVTVALGPEPPGPGDPAPSFDVERLDGTRATSDDWDGEVVLLDFWATWCVGCIGATPRMNRLHDEYGPKGFSVVSLNQEPDDRPAVARVVRERDIRYPVLIDPGRVAQAYGVGALPTVVLIDAKGIIRARHTGPIAESTLRREIEAALPAVNLPP
jgi:thiol-disulfide isomerase/thioredoxin